MKSNKTLCPAAIIFATLTLFFAFALQGFAGDESASMSDVKKETMEALDAIKSYTANQRDETVKKAKEVIQELDADIGRLESRIEDEWDAMDRQARNQAKSALDSLRKQRNELAEWYGGIKHSSAGAWEEVKNGFVESYETLKKSFDDAAEEF